MPARCHRVSLILLSEASLEARIAPLVVGDLIWKPFDLRFRSVLDTLSFQQTILREELDTAVTEQLQRGIDKIQDEQKAGVNQATQKKILDKIRALEEDGSEKSLQFELLKQLLQAQTQHIDRATAEIRRVQIESVEFLSGLAAVHDQRALGRLNLRRRYDWIGTDKERL